MSDIYIIKVKVFDQIFNIFIDKTEDKSWITTAFLRSLDKRKLKSISIECDSNGSFEISNFSFSINYVKMKFSLKIIQEEIPMIVLGKDWLRNVKATFLKRKHILEILYNNYYIEIPILDYLAWINKSRDESLKPKKKIQNTNEYQVGIISVQRNLIKESIIIEENQPTTSKKVKSRDIIQEIMPSDEILKKESTFSKNGNFKEETPSLKEIIFQEDLICFKDKK